MRRTKAFTLVELLVVVAIIAILASLLLPSLGRARELARQATCTANLNTVGKAMALYVSDADDKTPRLGDAVTPDNTLDGTTYANIFPEEAGDPDNSQDMDDVMVQNVWLMIRKGSVTEDAFHCPSDSAWKNRADYDDQPEKHGWRWKTDISYGMHWAYEKDSADTQNPAAMNTHLDGGMVIFADQNPGSVLDGTPQAVSSLSGSTVKPSNHPKDGEAVLTMNNSTRFYKERDEKESDRPKDSKAGKNANEIYESNQNGTMPEDGSDPKEEPGEWDTFICVTKGEEAGG